MELSIHLRRANTELSIHFRMANIEPSINFLGMPMQSGIFLLIYLLSYKILHQSMAQKTLTLALDCINIYWTIGFCSGQSNFTKRRKR